MTAQPATRPAPGKVVEIAPGLLRACMPLPGPPSHVNCWLLEDGEGWLVVDTGRGDAATRGWWECIFATNALGGRPVTRVLVTHFHPDHVGLAGWLCAEWNAPLLMPRSEWQRTRLLLAEDDALLLAGVLALLRRAGASASHLAWVAAEGLMYRGSVLPPPATYRPIAEGETLRIGGRDWQVRIGAGHAPEMACLHDPTAGILISADHILPRISPHVGIQANEPEHDPLGIYLRDLARFASLPHGTHVLPSHGEPFDGLHARILALQDHHATALHRLQAGLAPGWTAADAIPLLFGRRIETGRQHSFALAESLAHLRHLAARGRITCELAADGAWRFAPSSTPG